MMRKLSLIVPIYKTSKYMDKCIESITNQKFRDLEIILVDDGSPDDCPQKCDEWAKKDERIKVVHKQNGGVSSARNEGIKISSGDYLIFVDGDDYVLPTLTDCFEKVKNQDIVIVPFFEERYQEKTLITAQPIKNKFYSKKVSNISYNSVCFKFFKTSFIKDNELLLDSRYKMAEDLKFSVEAMVKAESIEYIDEPFYVYQRNDFSATAKISFEKIKNTLDVCKHLIELNKSCEDKDKHNFIKKLISENLLSVFVRSLNYTNEQNRELVEELQKIKKHINYGSTFKKKIAIFLIKIFGIRLVAKVFKIR